ncbi:uncharacterized protein C8Q71DRAFT_419649 [Rhodofomes roseus]|uniref:Uncharacterized protein n=1 Tax=Rhodofomes roseus TaxID=34475 RepID=A0ABQ8KPZ0_9APHY|nr:uncharacterized protein C8Q71DRAFT_419649 [Rhodofomes roseus]KAH9840676.1 hypothetical protein C8Q71DRAFT_419649 [Rhodofomes roseus]
MPTCVTLFVRQTFGIQCTHESLGRQPSRQSNALVQDLNEYTAICSEVLLRTARNDQTLARQAYKMDATRVSSLKVTSRTPTHTRSQFPLGYLANSTPCNMRAFYLSFLAYAFIAFAAPISLPGTSVAAATDSVVPSVTSVVIPTASLTAIAPAPSSSREYLHVCQILITSRNIISRAFVHRVLRG